MEKKWDVCVRAKNVEFRILKGGERASAYERDWKGAHVSFSISANKEQYVMTVEFLYGKRIDILVRIFQIHFKAEKCVRYFIFGVLAKLEMCWCSNVLSYYLRRFF